MVFNGKRFAALGVDGSDVLLYFLESALDFPAGGIKLDHLFCCKRKVGCTLVRKEQIHEKYGIELRVFPERRRVMEKSGWNCDSPA